MSEHVTADGVQKEVDGVTGDVEDAGVVQGHDDRPLRNVNDLGQGQLLKDEVSQNGNVKNDVSGRDNYQHNSQLEAAFLMVVVVMMMTTTRVVLIITRLRPHHLPLFALDLRHAKDYEYVQDGDYGYGKNSEQERLHCVEDGERFLVFPEHCAHVILFQSPDVHHVIGCDEDADDDEDGGAGESGAQHRAHLFEPDRQVDGDPP